MAQTEMQVMKSVANRRRYSFLPYRSVNSKEYTSPITSALLSELNIGLILIDQMETIIEMNSAVFSLLGLDRETFYARTIMDLVSYLDHQEELDRLVPFLTRYSPLEQLELSWNTCGSPERLVFRKGRQEETGLTFFLIENKTEQYRLTEQVRFRDRLATIGQIAAGTAHEIRNPLTSIQGFLQMIGDRLQECGQLKEKSYIEIMLKEIGRINHLVSEFLVLSRPRKLQFQLISIRKVLKEILPIIKGEARLHNIDVTVEINTVHALDLLGDAELLKQVFLNISKNAIEAMQKTGGTLTLRLTRSEKQYLVEIIDQGPGIPKALQEEIFEPFFTTKENGTGLGLPICKQIIRELGGNIELLSSSKGCNFRVYLPVAN